MGLAGGSEADVGDRLLLAGSVSSRATLTAGLAGQAQASKVSFLACPRIDTIGQEQPAAKGHFRADWRSSMPTTLNLQQFAATGLREFNRPNLGPQGAWYGSCPSNAGTRCKSGYRFAAW